MGVGGGEAGWSTRCVGVLIEVIVCVDNTCLVGVRVLKGNLACIKNMES